MSKFTTINSAVILLYITDEKRKFSVQEKMISNKERFHIYVLPEIYKRFLVYSFHHVIVPNFCCSDA